MVLCATNKGISSASLTFCFDLNDKSYSFEVALYLNGKFQREAFADFEYAVDRYNELSDIVERGGIDDKRS